MKTTSPLRVYKAVSCDPQLIIEIEDPSSIASLTLFANDQEVKAIEDIMAFTTVDIEKTAVYQVKAVMKEGQEVVSEGLVFDIEQYNALFPRSLARKASTINLKTAGNDPIIEGVTDYFIELKIEKGAFAKLEPAIRKLFNNVTITAKQFDLSSFAIGHEIYKVDYFNLEPVEELTAQQINDICCAIEQYDEVMYCAYVPSFSRFSSARVTKEAKTTNKRSRKKETTRRINTPNFLHKQLYLQQSNYGMNVINAWNKGYAGKGAVIHHLDFGVYDNHEMFQTPNFKVVKSRSKNEDCHHGTASVGTIISKKGDYGVTGIAHEAQLYFYDTSYLDLIVQNAKTGDIVSLDIQVQSGNDLLPIIAVRSWWDRIKMLTDKGVIVIAAAGNGSLDISRPSVCPDYGESGVMLVGSVQSRNGRLTSHTNYNHRDLAINSWGDSVFTTGYGDYQYSSDRSQDYTAYYSGTSSATPLCSGALAVIQGYAKSRNMVLMPAGMRFLLECSTSAEGYFDGVGHRPNVDQLIGVLDSWISALN